MGHKEEGAATAAAEEEIVLVAISKHPSSFSALKWTLSNKILKANGSLKLLHILRSNAKSVDQVSPEALVTYSREVRAKTEKQLEPHKKLCDEWKVHAELVIVEGNEVGKSLVNQIIRLKAKKFIIGTSSRNGFLRKLKGPTISDFVIKNSSDSCTIIVVSNDKLIAIKEAIWVPDLPHWNDGMHSNDSSCDGSSGSLSAVHGALAPEKKLNRNKSESEVERRRDRVLVSPPLPLQIQRAACLTNLKHGWPSVRGLRINNAEAHHFSSLKEKPTNDCISDCDPGENSAQDPEEGILNDHIDVNSSKVLDSYGSDSINDKQTKSQRDSMVSEENSGNSGNFLVLNDTRSSFDGAVGYMNETENGLDEVETAHKTVSQVNAQDQVQDDVHKLKVELKRVQQRVMSAEQAVAMAVQKENELSTYAKEERRKREQALVIAKLAKREAVIEAKKFDEALIALKSAKIMAEKESQMRREAEDRANKEALDRQTALSALQQAQMKYRQYSFEELKIATNGFSELNQIGLGGYGPVYRGMLHHTMVAIKVLKKDSVQGPREFQHEVDFLSRMHHPHLVLLLGACREQGCLVYEYLVNGSLEDRLYCKGGTLPLPWHLRFQIIAEVTIALVFLHSLKPDPYVHRDLKPANILLDQNFSTKLGDVGLARLAPSITSHSVTVYKDTNPVGTFAYIDPEYQRTGVFTPKSDVYALGLIMLQLLTGRGPIGLTAIVDIALREKTLDKVLDPMAGNWPISEATELAIMAINCSQLKRQNRPCLETDILPKLLKLKSFAEDYIAQTAWKKTQALPDSRQPVPSFFICPISKETMKDPHIASDGYTYEYSSIKQWLRDHKTSPMTNAKLRNKQLTPNLSLRSAISEWNQRLSRFAE